MNTSEVKVGSRLLQRDSEGVLPRDNTSEERFLVTWKELSYLHCSWETKTMLVESVLLSQHHLFPGKARVVQMNDMR